MGINYKAIYDRNRDKWKELTEEGNEGKYDTLVAGHYSENNHFVYELLQNADDAGASRIIFDFHAEKLCVYHNGRLFDQRDVEGICSFLDGTKDKDSIQQIGHFGLGFKSVFKYTRRPEVYSGDESFRIVRYLLPEKIKLDGFPKKCSIKVDGEDRPVFSQGENATMFVLPYREDILTGEASVNPSDIIEKLANLEPEILLFLNHISELQWVDSTSGRHGYYKKAVESEAETSNDSEYHVVTYSHYDSINGKKKERPLPYLIASKDFIVTTDKPHDSQISIAYRLNANKTAIVPLENAKIWVFFPTRDDSRLPFIIHGTYETPVSREKIMLPSKYNDELLAKTRDLIVESLDYLKDSRLLSQAFIKSILLPSLNSTLLPDLRGAVNNAFKENAFLPSRGDRKHLKIKDAILAIPDDLPKYVNAKIIEGTEYEGKKFADFSDVDHSADYVRWLLDELQVAPFTLYDFCAVIKNRSVKDFGDYDEFIRYLASCLDDNRGRGTIRYNEEYAKGHSAAIQILPTLKIIKSKSGAFVSAKDEDGNDNLFFEGKSDYQTLPKNKLVASSLAKDENLRYMLEEYFEINEFDNERYVRESIIPKYIPEGSSGINVSGDEEHIDDIHAILEVIAEKRLTPGEIEDLIGNAYILQITSTKNKSPRYLKVCTATPYFPKSDTGIDIKSYYDGIDKEHYFVRERFYAKNGVTRNDLRKLGATDSLVVGCDIVSGTLTASYSPRWTASDGFKWLLSIESLESVLNYITANPDTPSAKCKSQTIMKLLQENETKLSGIVFVGGNRYRNINPAYADVINILAKNPFSNEKLKWGRYNHIKLSWYGDWPKWYDAWDGKWLFSKDGKLVAPREISKFDLDVDLYGEPKSDSLVYKLLGFLTDERDRKAQTEKEYLSIPQEKRMSNLDAAYQTGELEQYLAAKGIRLEAISSISNYSSGSAYAAPDEEFEFPSRPVRNLESLRVHVQQAVYCADPVKFEKVLRSIRTSKDTAGAKAYLDIMYGSHLCQMCKRTKKCQTIQFEDKPKLELEQMHLQLCNDCADKYKAARAKSAFANKFVDGILSAEIDGDCPINISADDITVCFTQTHLAEIQEIIKITAEDGE